MKGVDFAQCTFKNAIFFQIEFSVSAFLRVGVNFSNATFNRCKFDSCFIQNKDLSKCSFTMSEFIKCSFFGCDFSSAEMYGIKITGGSLDNCSFIDSNLNSSELSSCKLTSVDFTHAQMNQATLKNMSIEKITIVPVKNKLLSPIKHFHLGLRLDNIYGNALLEKSLKDTVYIEAVSERHPKLYRLWLLSSDCGRSILRWLFLVMLLVFMFASIYTAIGAESFTINEELKGFEQNTLSQFIMFTYYSVVTLTTLGFGDISPKETLSMIFVVLEVFLGYITLGALITIFANKLGR
jgi:hypothetical protein